MQGNPRQVVTANRQALTLFGKELEAVAGHRGGQVFDCVHSFTEAGCGKDQNCEGCSIKDAIVDTFTTGSPHQGVAATLQLKKDGATESRVVQVSTEKIGELALVRIERYDRCDETWQQERNSMEQAERKAKIRETFNTVAAGYDTPALRFFADNPRHLATYLDLRGDEHLLDVATGTGNAALALAAMLPGGRVTGVDFAAAMLDRARARAETAGLANVEFIEMDMQALTYPDGHFSAACCAFGIFFVEDMEGQLAHIAAKVQPGGRVVISGFTEHAFSPLVDIFYVRLRHYGVEPPPLSWKRIASEAGCEALFRNSGLTDIRVGRQNLGYFLTGPEEWWEVIWQAGFRGLVNQLAPDDLQQFRAEHLKEVEALRTPEGIRLEVEALYTVGTRP